jgi:hypothetical protein
MTMPAKTRSGTESNLKRQVMRMLSAEFPGAVVRKRHGSVYSTVGDPDVMILYQGIHIECELKRLGEQPTAIQLHRLEKWRKAGAIVAVIHSVGEMRTLMESLK